MRTMKKFGALLCAAALVFGLAACGEKPAAGDNVVDILTAADQKLAEANSVEVSALIDMAASATANGETEEMAITAGADLSVIMEPMKLKGDLNLDLGDLGGMMSMGLYAAEENEALNLYIGMMGTWMSQTIDMSMIEEEETEGTTEFSFYAENASSFKSAGEETVNDVQATKYTGTISGASMEKLMTETGTVDMMDQMGDMGTGVAIDWGDFYKDMGDVQMSVWISEDGYPVRYEMDLADMVNQIMAKAMEQTAAAYGVDAGDMEISFSKMLFTADIKNIDAVEDFEIPEEVTSAAIAY